ncbi:MAG TPA: hypothetical protein VGB91_14330 [Rhizomicrobium sp.]
MTKISIGLNLAGTLIAMLLIPSSAHAHGVVGDRFFPATIASDDPFAADELALPTISLGNHEEDYDFEYTKTIFPHFAVSFEGGYVNSHAPGAPNASGWDNFEITPIWQFITDGPSEFVASAGMGFEIGGSGARAVADSFTTYTPQILFGKGFGDLPDSMALLRPLAVTGVLAYAIPGTSGESKSLQWSGAVEYSLLYLQNNVRNQGFSKFVAHLTPLVEFALSTPTDTGGGGTTGTINPGILWSGQYSQLGVEAVVPVNRASGDNVGVLMQLHFYIDDIFPHSLGTPIFGGNP